MPLIAGPARKCARWGPFVFLIALMGGAPALEFREALRSEKLPEGLSALVSPQSKGHITPTPDGVLITSETNRYALLKFDGKAAGSDDEPLLAAVRIRTSQGNEGAGFPGLYLYWDAKNYAYARATHDTHIYYGWVINGEDTSLHEGNVMRESRMAEAKFYGKEVFVRILLVSRNMAFFVSHDGVNWRKIAETGARPGAGGAAPTIFLGRGYTGEKPELMNDASRESRTSTKAYFSELSIIAKPPAVKPDGPDIAKNETWEQTLAALEPAGIPRTWQYVSPAGDSAFWNPKDWIQNDNWAALKEVGGRAVKFGTWTKPDDEAEDPLIDLRDSVQTVKNSTLLLKTEIEWPLSGEAMLWFDSVEPSKVVVNGATVHSHEGNEWWRERRPVKDRSGIPVRFNKGTNTVKVALRVARGEAAFCLRSERNDPAYRIGLLEKMLELFPAPQAGWRSAGAMVDLARKHEEAFDFRGALTGYSAALSTLKDDEENRLRAFEGKLRVHAFLRDFGGAVKTAEEWLAKYPNEDSAADAMRAILRYETLAGRAAAARDRAKSWSTKGASLSAVEMMRVVAGALSENGSRDEFVAMLEEIAGMQELKSEDRAHVAIAGSCWRWEFERRKARQRGADPDPAEQTRAIRSMLASVQLLPGAKNPVVAEFVREAEHDIQAKKFDRAFGTAWAAALTALLNSDPDAAYYYALSKPYPIALPLMDKNNNEIKDQNQFRDVAWATLREKCGDPAWSGKWRSVAFRRNRDGKADKDIDGPEKNSDPNTRYGDKGWTEIEPEGDKSERTEFGFDVRRFGGDSQVAYLTRDFEMPATGDTTLYLSNAGTWSAWIDGKLVGRDMSADAYKIEADRIPIRLEKGRHRLLVKVELPAEGAVPLRVRIGTQPHLAMLLYIQALAARQFPSSMTDRMGDLNMMRDAMARRTNSEALMAFSNAVSHMYDDQRWYAFDQLMWTSQVLHEMNQDAQSLQALRGALRRLEDGAEYQGRAQKALELSRALARALVREGEIVAADTVLRDASNKHPLPAQESALCVAWRGVLRWELGLSQAALPFFERCAHEGKLSDETRQLVSPGLEWARYYRPERVAYESPRDVQSLLDAVRRQLDGAPDDVEKAMRGLGDILRNSSNALVKISETPFALRFVGVREYVRAMLEAMPQAQRDAYQKVVGESAAQRLKTVTPSDPAALEKAALEFPQTAESRAALNRAADLYFDRGQYGQAASIYLTLLREPASAEQNAMAAAKLCLSQAFDGKRADAQATLKRLETEFGAMPLKVKGETLNGSVLAAQLKAQIEPIAVSAPETDSDQMQFMGGLTRTGAARGPAPEPGGVAWAQPLIASGALDHARSTFGIETQPHLQPFPVTDGTRVFVGAMESLRAFDLNNGNILWTQTWAGGSAAAASGFAGFPSSVPLVTAGKIVMRAQSLNSSLRCFDAVSGALLWSSDAQPELRKLVWISDPVSAYGMIYAEFMDPGDFNLHGIAALDSETGRLKWKNTLASGSTGIKVGQMAYYQASNHLGPPAVDAGEIYIETGLASIAAINAFNGEARWVSSYPRMQLGDLRRGQTNVFDMSARMFRTFSRGPLSPMLLGHVVIVAPHDGNGVLAFDRRDGSLLWHRELAGCRFVAGVADGNIIACDNGVTAISAETGKVAWRVALEGRNLYGAPTLSGGVLYLPLRTGLMRLDARNGAVIGTTAWDPRIGPAANALITRNRIVAITERTVVALGTGGANASALPYYEARRLEAEGRLEEAVLQYAQAERSEKEGMPAAMTARIRLLKQLGKRDEALAELTRFEREAPVTLSAMGGLWKTRRDAVVRSLRKSLGENVAEPDSANQAGGDLNGVLAYSYFLPGENPQLARFPDDPPSRLYARINGDIQALNAGETPEILWSSYVGTQVKRLMAGDALIGAMSDREIAILDRMTGEPLSQILVPNVAEPDDTKKRRAVRRRADGQVQSEAFTAACIGGGNVYASTNARLCAWDALSGKLLWERALVDDRPVAGGLSVQDGVLVRVSQQHRESTVVTAYNCSTGSEINTLNVDTSARVTFTPDFKYMAARTTARLTCVDLRTLTVLWRKDVSEIEPTYSTLEFTPEGAIRLQGGSRRDGGKIVVRLFDIASGNETVPAVIGQYVTHSDRGEYIVAERGYKISRVKPNGNSYDTIWTTKPPNQPYAEFSFLRSYTSGAFFHTLYVRSFDNSNREQIYLRTLAWDGGARIVEQPLPGTPINAINTYNNQKYVASAFIQAGGTLAYTAKEGIFFVRARGTTTTEAAEKFRQELRNPELQADRLKHTRRALAGLEQPEAQAFITPAGARVDGDLSEWGNTEPISLSHRSDYVPLTDGASWGGAAALSAKIYSGWNHEGITVAVDVTDAVSTSPRPGAEMATGDRLRVVIDSRDGENSALDSGECFAGTLALVNSTSFFTQEHGAVSESGLRAEGKVAPSASRRGRQYELFVPWTALRKNPAERPGDRREVRLGVAIYDGTQNGSQGALQWGAGVTMPSAVPMWLGRITLVDISAEKIERYRKVIAMASGSPEALKFLRLILLSKRGAEAQAERALELEKFIADHPQSAHTPKVLSMLRETYREMGDADPSARAKKFAQSNKVSDAMCRALDDGFRVWVYPDPKQPPQQIMLQFSNGDFSGGVVRAYWGSPVLPWGKDGTITMRKLGELPKPGQWTELVVPALDFDLEKLDLRAFAFSSSGGLANFDRAGYTAGGKETVLIDDKLPEKWQAQYSEIKFVNQPRHDGESSLVFTTFCQQEGIYNTHFTLDNWTPVMDFSALRFPDESAKDLAKYESICRSAAQILNDSPEGLAFLRRAIDLNAGDEKQKCAKAIAEIKDFMKQNSGSPNAYESLKLLREYFVRAEEKDPAAKCAEFIAEVKPPVAATRAFYGDFAPAWLEWWVLGAFSAMGERRGMETSMEPERGVDLKFKTQINNKEVTWKKVSAKTKNNDTIVDMRALLSEREYWRGPYFGYAYTKFNCPDKRKALIAFGADDVISIWINGKRVVNEVYTSAQKDKETAEVQLRSGENEILIKVGVQRERLSFVFRLADLNGKPFEDIRNE